LSGTLTSVQFEDDAARGQQFDGFLSQKSASIPMKARVAERALHAEFGIGRAQRGGVTADAALVGEVVAAPQGQLVAGKLLLPVKDRLAEEKGVLQGCSVISVGHAFLRYPNGLANQKGSTRPGRAALRTRRKSA
jgi:hypothetical protein